MAGDDDVVADNAIMGDVRVGEEDVIITEDGPFTFLGARVNAYVFAENIFSTYFETRFTGTSFQILSATTNEGVGEDFAVGPQLSESFDRRVVMNRATIGKGDVCTDEGISTNGYVVPDFRA